MGRMTLRQARERTEKKRHGEINVVIYCEGGDGENESDLRVETSLPSDCLSSFPNNYLRGFEESSS